MNNPRIPGQPPFPTPQMRISQTQEIRVPHLRRSRIAPTVGYSVPAALYGLFLFFGLLSLLPAEMAGQAPAKRPMTFADMMQMRRLGATEVSPDGKWLVYSVTDVDLAKNSKTDTLWIQEIKQENQGGGNPRRLEGTEPGDGGAKFSHDGKHLLFLSSRSGSQQIYVAGFDAASGVAGIAQRATNIAQCEANIAQCATPIAQRDTNIAQRSAAFPEADNAIWAPDGKSIIFTAEVYPDCPAVTPENPEAAKCTLDRDAVQAASPVKAKIFTHLLYKHWNHFTGDKRSHLFRLDLATGSVRDLTPDDPRDVPPFSLEGGCGCAVSPDSKELAFTENLDEEPAISTNSDIFTLDLTNPAAKPNKISTSPGGDLNPAYSPDGKYLAWRSQARAGYESDKFRLALFDRQKRILEYPLSSAVVFEPGPKLANFDRWVDEFSWRDDSKVIYFVSGFDGEAPIQSISLEPIPRDAELALPPGGDRISIHRQLSSYGKTRGEWSGIHGVMVNGRFRLLGTLMRVDMPSEVVLADPLEIDDSSRTITVALDNSAPTKDITQAEYPPLLVTHLNDGLLAQLELPKMASFWFRAADKTKVQGFLIKPPGFDPAKKYPVKFLIHGGPQGAWGDAWSYRWNAELFAANGYVVVMINPRGSTGYGQAFVDGVNGDWGGKPFTDLMLGLDYAEKTYPFIDKNRECALGASYGGYMANWILGHTNRFQCIVTHDGMFDPESAYGSTEELWFNEWEFKGRPWDYYGKPDSENPFRKWSPALSAKNFKTPTLVIHSQLDYRLDVSEGYQLFTTLQRLKIPSEMLYFPDEGHWVLKPQNSELWYKTVNAWVDQWTASDREQGRGAKE
jgi:dipeptidyl aminopeptidase/acylaminoacyl peptidase